MLLITNAHVAGRPREERATVLVAEGIVTAVGNIDPAALRAAKVDVEIVDAAGSLLAPGIVLSRVPGTQAIPPEVTTWVGVTSFSLDAVPHVVLARVRQARRAGDSAWMWSGGNQTTLTRSAAEDVALVEEVIGIGELFLSDVRSTEPSALELARIATDGYLAALEAGKCGLLHLSVGSGKRRMARLFEAIRSFDVEPSWFYATVSNPAGELLQEAAELTQRGMPIDLASPSPKDFARYREAGADLRLTTVSGSTPLETVRSLVSAGVASVEEALPLITANPAGILKLGQSGEIAPGRRADLLLLEPETLELRKVIRARPH